METGKGGMQSGKATASGAGRPTRQMSWRLSILTWVAGSAAAWVLIASPFINDVQNGGPAQVAIEEDFFCEDDDIECWSNLAPAAGPGVGQGGSPISPVDACMSLMPATGADISDVERTELQSQLEDCLAHAYSGGAGPAGN